jgi:hypothetical protein
VPGGVGTQDLQSAAAHSKYLSKSLKISQNQSSKMFGIKVRSPFKKSKSAKAGADDNAGQISAADVAIDGQGTEVSAAVPPSATVAADIGSLNGRNQAVPVDNVQIGVRGEASILPKDVSAWKSGDVLNWLRTIFDGSEHLPA